MPGTWYPFWSCGSRCVSQQDGGVREQCYDHLIGEVASFIPGNECDSPVTQSDFDSLISGYGLTRTALYRNTALLRLRYIGIPPCSDHVISGYRLAQTALYRGTALLRPPYLGMPPYSDRLGSGYGLTQTALYRYTALLRPPYIGIPSYSDRLISGDPYCTVQGA